MIITGLPHKFPSPDFVTVEDVFAKDDLALVRAGRQEYIPPSNDGINCADGISSTGFANSSDKSNNKNTDYSTTRAETSSNEYASAAPMSKPHATSSTPLKARSSGDAEDSDGTGSAVAKSAPNANSDAAACSTAADRSAFDSAYTTRSLMSSSPAPAPPMSAAPAALIESWVRREISYYEDSFTTVSNLRVSVTTFNVANKRLTTSLNDLLAHTTTHVDPHTGATSPMDVIVLALQEIDMSARAMFMEETEAATAWVQGANAVLGASSVPGYTTSHDNTNVRSSSSNSHTSKGSDAITNNINSSSSSSSSASKAAAGSSAYYAFPPKQLVGLLLCVYIRRPLLRHVTHSAIMTVATGSMGTVGNKGAVGFHMTLHRTSVCIITAHLASGQTNWRKRNDDIHTILQGMDFNAARRAAAQAAVSAAAASVGHNSGNSYHPSSPALSGQGNLVTSYRSGQSALNGAVPTGAGNSKDNDSCSSQPNSNNDARQHNSKRGSGAGGQGLSSQPTQSSTSSGSNANANRSAPLPPSAFPELLPRDHDIVIVAGDLNYRLELSYEEVLQRIERHRGGAKISEERNCCTNTYTENTHPHASGGSSIRSKRESVHDALAADLLTHDQLTRELANPWTPWHGFTDLTPRFRPTYRYDMGTNRYDTSEKHRIPSYTDRILFYTRRERAAAGVRIERVRALDDILWSDHKPVQAVLQLPVRVEVPARKVAVLAELRQGARRCGMDRVATARTAMSTHAVELGEMGFGVRGGAGQSIDDSAHAQAELVDSGNEADGKATTAAAAAAASWMGEGGVVHARSETQMAGHGEGDLGQWEKSHPKQQQQQQQPPQSGCGCAVVELRNCGTCVAQVRVLRQDSATDVSCGAWLRVSPLDFHVLPGETQRIEITATVEEPQLMTWLRAWRPFTGSPSLPLASMLLFCVRQGSVHALECRATMLPSVFGNTLENIARLGSLPCRVAYAWTREKEEEEEQMRSTALLPSASKTYAYEERNESEGHPLGEGKKDSTSRDEGNTLLGEDGGGNRASDEEAVEEEEEQEEGMDVPKNILRINSISVSSSTHIDQSNIQNIRHNHQRMSTQLPKELWFMADAIARQPMTPGLFITSADAAACASVMEHLNTTAAPLPPDTIALAAAECLLSFFKNLQDPIVPRALFATALSAGRAGGEEAVRFIRRLPVMNANIFIYVISLLNFLLLPAHSKENGLHASLLAPIFAAVMMMRSDESGDGAGVQSSLTFNPQRPLQGVSQQRRQKLLREREDASALVEFFLTTPAAMLQKLW